MQINDSGLSVACEIAYLFWFQLTMVPRCRQNVGLFYHLVFACICLSKSLLISIQKWTLN